MNFQVNVLGRTYELRATAPAEKVIVPTHFGDKVAIEDVCRILGVTRPTVNQMVIRGDLTRFAMGNRLYVPWADIENVLTHGCKPRERVQKRKLTPRATATT